MVSSVGAASEAIVNADVPVMVIPNVGDKTVHPGLPLASYVIHTKSCRWNNGKGEAVSESLIEALELSMGLEMSVDKGRKLSKM